MKRARLAKSRRRSPDLLLDANLLVLYFVGARRPDLIPSFHRTRHYIPGDFALLQAFLSQYRRITTTPHILTEVSNLTGQLAEPLRSELRLWVAKLIEHWTEHFTPAKTLTRDPAFARFGLTDVAVSAAAAGALLVLTDDFALCGLLKQRGLSVIRFDYLRDDASQS